MKISQIKFYGGSREKVCRLGLSHIFLELLEILISTNIHVREKKQANGAGRVRELIDERFGDYQDWVQSKSGNVDWIKRLLYNRLSYRGWGSRFRFRAEVTCLPGTSSTYATTCRTAISTLEP